MATILGDAFDKQFDVFIQQAADLSESLSSTSRRLIADWNVLLAGVVEIYKQLDRAKREAVQSAIASGSVDTAKQSALVEMHTKVVACSRALLSTSEQLRSTLDPSILAALEQQQRIAIGFLDAEALDAAQQNVTLSAADAARIDQLLKS